MALYAPIGNGNLWRNIDDLTDTTYGQVAVVGGKRKLVVGDQVGELCLMDGKRRYLVEEQDGLKCNGPYPISILFNGKIFYNYGYTYGGLYYIHCYNLNSAHYLYTMIRRLSDTEWCYNENNANCSLKFECKNNIVTYKEESCLGGQSVHINIPSDTNIYISDQRIPENIETANDDAYNDGREKIRYLINGVWTGWYSIPTC